MKANSLYNFLLLVGVVSIFSLAFTPFFGEPVVSRQAQTKPDVYLMNITVLNISNIDLSAGTYAVDMFISFICQDAPCKN
jgi:hypothetical protein